MGIYFGKDKKTPAEYISSLSCDDILISIEYHKNMVNMLENEYRKKCRE